MAWFNLFLSCKRPELDRSWADDDIVCERVISQRAQRVVRAVHLAVSNRLDAFEANEIPNFDNLVRTKTNEMVSFFVEIEFDYSSVVTIELDKLL